MSVGVVAYDSVRSLKADSIYDMVVLAFARPKHWWTDSTFGFDGSEVAYVINDTHGQPAALPLHPVLRKSRAVCCMDVSGAGCLSSI